VIRSHIVALFEHTVEILLVLGDVFVILLELLVEQCKSTSHSLSLLRQITNHIMVWQFVQMQDHLLRVCNELRYKLCVQF
jgi:hypothetical protein